MNNLVDYKIINIMRNNIFKSIYEIPYASKIAFYGASGTGKQLKSLFELYRPDIDILCFFDTYKEGYFCNLPTFKLGSQKFEEYFSKVDYIIVSSLYDYDVLKSIKYYYEDYEKLKKFYFLTYHLLNPYQNFYKNIIRKNIKLEKQENKNNFIVIYPESLKKDIIIKITDKVKNRILKLSPKHTLVPIKLTLDGLSREVYINVEGGNIISFFDTDKIKVKKKFSEEFYKYSVIIVNYKTEDYILKLLETINKNTYDNLEIIIVDNNPQGLDDLIKDKLKETKIFSKIKYIPSNKNLGYAGGVNLGSLFTTGDIIHILNPDILLSEKFYNIVNYYINLYGEESLYGHPYISQGSLTLYQSPASGLYGIFSYNLFSVLNNSLSLGCLGTSCFIPIKLLEKTPRGKIYNDFLFLDAEDLDFSLYMLSKQTKIINLYNKYLITPHEFNVSFSMEPNIRRYHSISKVFYIFFKYYKDYISPIDFVCKIDPLIKTYGDINIFLNMLRLIEDSLIYDIYVPEGKINNNMNFWFNYSGLITLEEIINEGNV